MSCARSVEASANKVGFRPGSPSSGHGEHIYEAIADYLCNPMSTKAISW